MANIGADALVALAPALLAALAPDGRIVVSGLLDPPRPDVAPAYAPLVVEADTRLDGWTALTLRCVVESHRRAGAAGGLWRRVKVTADDAGIGVTGHQSAQAVGQGRVHGGAPAAEGPRWWTRWVVRLR